jgi:DNA-binding NtrC family response regulator
MDAKQESLPAPADTHDNAIEMRIEVGDLPLADAVQEFEKQYITRLIVRNHGHKGKTAAMLEIDRKTLYRKLKKYGILEKIWTLNH